METWETGWEVGFPAANADEMLLALVVRDLVHGASFDVESHWLSAGGFCAFKSIFWRRSMIDQVRLYVVVMAVMDDNLTNEVLSIANAISLDYRSGPFGDFLAILWGGSTRPSVRGSLTFEAKQALLEVLL